MPTHPPGRALLAAALLVAALALLAAPATAQSGCDAPELTLEETPGTFQPQGTTTLAVTITNPNPVAADATFTLNAPAGWTTGQERQTVTVASGSSEEIRFTVTAPAQRQGVAQGRVVAESSLQCNYTFTMPTSSVASTSFDVAVEQSSTPWTTMLAGGVILVGGVFAVLAVRSRRASLELDCAEPLKEVSAGRGASFPLHLVNRRGEPDTVRLELLEVPEGWSAFVAVPEIELEPKEERELWLMIRSPPEASAGESATVTVEAVPARGDQGDRTVVRATVVDVAETAPVPPSE